jgi:hypothetical protein
MKPNAYKLTQVKICCHTSELFQFSSSDVPEPLVGGGEVSMCEYLPHINSSFVDLNTEHVLSRYHTLISITRRTERMGEVPSLTP